MIRDLTPLDALELTDLLEVMAAESIYSDFGLHRARSQFILADMIGKPGVFASGGVTGDKITSLLIGEVTDHLFFDGRVASEIILYTHPEYRKGMTAKRLIDAFSEWASTQGADFVQFEASVGIDNTKAGRFFSICGLPPCGTVHSRRI